MNEDKTRILEIDTKSIVDFRINNKIVKRLAYVKYLRYVIDNKLQFNERIEYTCNTIGKR